MSTKASDANRESRNLLMDAFAFLLNVGSSVVIVFVNKQLMSPRGSGFNFAVTLSALHYLVCTIYMWIMQWLGVVKQVSIPLQDLFYFTAVADLSIISLNVSLLLNPVGFYQIAKLLVIPFVCLVEYTWFGRHFPFTVIAAVLTVVLGVGIVTVSASVTGSSLFGIFVAGLSVVGSGMQQILCRSVQQKNNISSQELLARIAPLQGFSLIAMGPFMDQQLMGTWVAHYQWTSSACAWLVLSCSVAVLVNISQFMVLGRFSASTFQVLGHSKTILVLLGGWLLFKEMITPKQLLGMTLAVAGMVWYGRETSKPKVQPKALAPESAPLLQSVVVNPQLVASKDLQLTSNPLAAGERSTQ